MKNATWEIPKIRGLNIDGLFEYEDTHKEDP